MTTAGETPEITAECPRCQIQVLAPDWSEALDAGRTVHVWRCPICDQEFETIEDRVEPELPEQELVEDFMPNLLVA